MAVEPSFIRFDEVRSFARGIYPPLLAQRGLSEALRAAGRSAPLPTRVDAGGIRRFRPEIEATVYFACMEALQNAAKHAGEGTKASVRLHQNAGELRFEVADDGPGFDIETAGESAGLQNMSDRIGALGGELRVESLPDQGTRVSGSVPVS